MGWHSPHQTHDDFESAVADTAAEEDDIQAAVLAEASLQEREEAWSGDGRGQAGGHEKHECSEALPIKLYIERDMT